MISMTARPRLFLMAFCLLFMTTQTLQANEGVRNVLAELSKQVLIKLNKEKTKEVSIGKFDGPPTHKTSAGSSFAIILKEELTKLGASVQQQAKFGIKGSYSLTEIKATNPDDARIGKKVLALKVKLDISDVFANSEQIVIDRKIEEVVKGPEALIVAFGVTTPIPPDQTELEADAQLRKAIIGKPNTDVKGSLVRSQSDQPYAIEILVDGKPRNATDKDGLAFVGIKRNETYAVRLHNFTKFEAAVKLYVDGISIYEFSELRSTNPARKGRPRYTSIIVPAAKNGKPGIATVRGWHRTNKPGGEDSFLVTGYAKSAAAKLNRTSDLGVITATFQAAWEGKNFPSDEPGLRRGGQGDATGFGKPTGGGFNEVKRTLGVIRDSVSVRYTVAQ